MTSYEADYDTTIRTQTVVEQIQTWHRDGIDWAYPFDDPEHTTCMCRNDEAKKAEVEKLKGWLREVEKGGKCYVSNYGGWPRIWKEVLNVGMTSHWPYWKPRPTIAVVGTLGTEWYDWLSLTGFRREGEQERRLVEE